MRKPLTTIAITATLLVAGCTNGNTIDFASVTEECNVPTTTDYSRLLDNGKGYAVNTRGTETHGISENGFVCVLVAIETPENVVAEMQTTRALDGKQTAEWNKIKATWTYHPNDGLGVVFSPN